MQRPPAVIHEERLELALELRRARSLPVNQGDWLTLAEQDTPLATVESLLVPDLPDRFKGFLDTLR
jgi:hypothetical protein